MASPGFSAARRWACFMTGRSSRLFYSLLSCSFLRYQSFSGDEAPQPRHNIKCAAVSTLAGSAGLFEGIYLRYKNPELLSFITDTNVVAVANLLVNRNPQGCTSYCFRHVLANVIRRVAQRSIRIISKIFNCFVFQSWNHGYGSLQVRNSRIDRIDQNSLGGARIIVW